MATNNTGRTGLLATGSGREGSVSTVRRPSVTAELLPRVTGLLWPVLMLLGAGPLVVAHIAPLQDWPSHLARVNIMHSLLNGEPFWAEYYNITTFFLPNIALDAGVLLLMLCGLDVEAAGTVFLLLTYALFISGFLALARACTALSSGKIALAILLFYSVSLIWGFVNYVVGIGVGMWAVAWYLAGPPHPLRKAGLAVLAATVVFACHIIAAACLLVLLACQDMGAAWQLRRSRPLAGLAGCFAGSVAAAVVIVTLYALSPAVTDAQRGVMYYGSDNLLVFLDWKARTFAKAYLGGSVRSDIVVGLLVAALLGLAPFVRRVQIPLWAVLACVAFIVATIAAPHRVGAGAFLDNRLAALPLLVAAAATRLQWRRVMAGRVAVALLVIGAAARSSALMVDWSRTGAMLNNLDAHFATLPRGTVVVTVAGHPATDVSWGQYWSVPSSNVGVTAVRHGLFVPQVFAIPSQQPLELKPEFEQLRSLGAIRNAGQIEPFMATARVFCDGSHTTVPRRVQALVWFPAAYLNASTAPPIRPLVPGISTMELCDSNRPG